MQFTFTPSAFPHPHSNSAPRPAYREEAKSDDSFEFPQKIPQEAWDEFSNLSASVSTFDALTNDLRKKGLETVIISISGVAYDDDEYVYDPTSKTVGLWCDKSGTLRGLTRIRMRISHHPTALSRHGKKRPKVTNT